MLAVKMHRTIVMALFLFASVSLAKDAPDGLATEKADNAKKPTTDAGDPKRVFDFKITPDMKTVDLDDKKSALSKMIAFLVKGKDKASEYVSIVPHKNAPTEIKLEIRDDSIFIPGGDPANTQNGFRRTDVNPLIDRATTLAGVTTWYQTIRFDSKAPLVLAHGYLVSSIEFLPTGDHIFDIFAGSDFKSENTAHTPTENSQTIRVRDMATKTLFSLPFKYDQNYNFAVTVDWKGNMLTVYSSVDAEPLKMVAGPVANDPKAPSVVTKGKGEYHIQLIKMPLPDAKDPLEKRGDTPHLGFQEPIKKEHVFFSNVFATSGKEIEQPKFFAHKATKKAKACRRKLL